MGATARVLIGLIAGLAAGALLAAFAPGTAPAIAAWVEPVGLLWVNALRMTVIPLVFAGLVVGAASAHGAGSIGRLGARALGIFLALLAAAAAFTVLVAPALFALLPIDPAAAAGLQASARSAAELPAPQGIPDIGAWLVALVPPTPIKAAADGSLLPLIVFAVCFGIATTRVPAEARAAVRGFFHGVFEAMLALVRWVLALAPWGVAALALPLATRLGIAAAGAVGYYILVVSAISGLFIALLYPIVRATTPVGLSAFARGAAPAQAVAFSARSSLASLPAMIEGGERHLDFPAPIVQFFLPLSASTFRLGGAIGITAGTLFVAHLYGVELAPAQLATIALTAVLLTFSIPGVPGGAILVMMPVLVAVGLPPQAAGILLGVDTVPDMFRTTANVTGTMAAATILAEREPRPPAAGEAAPGPPSPADAPDRRAGIR
ncbi:MAG: dicarboxylate/amino acid:cation symporter [Gemmatimonadetes bacterium]|nr:dicarboxylate/amino acid:cation symporter [Gemmatimonadota bacterium]